MAMAKRSDPVTYRLPLQVVFDGLMAMLPFTSIVPVDGDRDEATIRARTGMSVSSWGEKVTIRLRESGPDQTSVEVESRLVFGLFAWGRHDRNFETVFRTVEILAAQGGAPDQSPPPGSEGSEPDG